ncbi:hypothetical protein JJQ72_19260 [Paenibacillus sp. F411]|nr:hypothetical protein [Paenibacillus sp. F411]MBO2946119.1 hypothetical protein [Paenibacillus sp. F411]
MKQVTPFTNLVQMLLTEEEVKEMVKVVGYEDKGRTFTVFTLLQYLTNAA